MHLATRWLGGELGLSRDLIPIISITAGCGHSVNLSRFHLFEVLDHVHRAWRPTEVSSWVDDLAQQTFGSPGMLLRHVPEVAIDIKERLQQVGIKISVKTALMASNKELGAKIVGELARRGLVVKFADSARDLGVDSSCGRLRRLGIKRDRENNRINRKSQVPDEARRSQAPSHGIG